MELPKTFRKDLFASTSLLAHGIKLRDPSGDAAHMEKLIKKAEAMERDGIVTDDGKVN